MEVPLKRKDSGQKPQVNKFNQERVFKIHTDPMKRSSWPSPSFLNRDLTIIATSFSLGRYSACCHQLEHGFIHLNQSVLTDKNLVMRKTASSINAADKSVLTWRAMRSDLGLWRWLQECEDEFWSPRTTLSQMLCRVYVIPVSTRQAGAQHEIRDHASNMPKTRTDN